jgi:high-affinity iron transporter
MARGIRVGVVVAAAVGVLALTVGFAAGQAKGDAKAGEAEYKAKCLGCHGASGAGDGPAGKVLKPPPRDWTKGDGLDLSDQQLFDSIKKGGEAVGRAKTMIAFPSLPDAMVWNLVAYVKSLKKT